MRLYKLNQMENKSKVLFFVFRYLRKIYISIQNLVIEIQANLRASGIITEKKYRKLKSLKNTAKSQRCFILATGPSLTLDDIQLLKNEFTIGMNAICKLYEKCDWRPSIFGIQDENVYERLEPILKHNSEGVLISSNIWNRYQSSHSFNAFPLNSKYNYYDFRYTNKLKVKYSDDAYRIVYDAYSITFSLLQIAIYMGFKEIYLLGCDCNQEIGKENHFVDIGYNESEDKLLTSAERNIFSHQEFKKYADMLGVKVFNATRGGALEVYPRVQLEDVLRK